MRSANDVESYLALAVICFALSCGGCDKNDNKREVLMSSTTRNYEIEVTKCDLHFDGPIEQYRLSTTEPTSRSVDNISMEKEKGVEIEKGVGSALGAREGKITGREP